MLLSIIFAHLFLFASAFAVVLPRQADGKDSEAAPLTGNMNTDAGDSNIDNVPDDVAGNDPAVGRIVTPWGGSGGAIRRGRPLYSASGDNICMDVQGARFEEGTFVQAWWCNGTPAQRWVYSHGRKTVNLAGTDFCLDASYWPASGTQLRIKKCSPGSSAQSWYYDPKHHRIQLGETRFCLQVPDRGQWVGNVLETQQCGYAGGRFQVWREDP